MPKVKTVKVKKNVEKKLIVSGHALKRMTQLDTEGIDIFVTFYSNLDASKSFYYVRLVDGILEVHIHSTFG